VLLGPGGDFYKVLDISPDATAQDVKRAYRRLAMRKHPDVNPASDAQAQFEALTEAYKTLIDPDARRLYDLRRRRRGGAPPPPYGRSGSSGYAQREPESPEARAARAERERRWREANPMPEDLNDSFGSLFGDVLRGVGRFINDLEDGAGLEDWLSYVETSAAAGSGASAAAAAAADDEILSSSDMPTLEAELTDVDFLVSQLESRLGKLQREVSAAEALAVEMLSRARDTEAPARRAAATDRATEARRDAAATRSQCDAVNAHLYRARDRKARLERRLAELRKRRRSPTGSTRREGGAPPSSASSRRPGSTDFDARVDDDLQRLKKQMGL